MEITNPINWADDTWAIEDKYAILNNLLSLYCCVVDFQKVNGERRRMRCTLRQDLIPVIESTRSRKIDTMRVWLPDEQVWRSFKVENVYNVEVD